ncbi:hypothetical protein GCM10028796_13480 [Ramlibacter monticola]
MALAAGEAIGKRRLRAYADRGYYSAPEIKACADAGISAYVPKPLTSGAKSDGRFGKGDFISDPKRDVYVCPAHQIAPYRFTYEQNDGQQIRRYWSSACPRCPMKDQCSPAPFRRISRWEHEAVLDDMQRRRDRQLDAMTGEGAP